MRTDDFCDVVRDETEADPLAHLGPIDAAVMDDGVVVVYGEDGLTHVSAQRDRFPDLGVPLKAREGGVVNRGANEGTPEVSVGLADPQSIDVDEDDEPDGHLSTRDIEALMRRKLHGGAHGSGSGSTGKAKPIKYKPTNVQRPLTDDDDPKRQAERLHITGLTTGEVDFFERRPGEALRVLNACAEGIIACAPEPEPFERRRRGGPKGCDLFVFGLSEGYAPLLRAFRWTARRALVTHARSVDPDRVMGVDAGHLRQIERRLETRRAS
jgi:hypothetical protein